MHCYCCRLCPKHPNIDLKIKANILITTRGQYLWLQTDLTDSSLEVYEKIMSLDLTNVNSFLKVYGLRVSFQQGWILRDMLTS